eukprot:14475409-Ditylum_brightwellii.AAC.1
MAPPPMVPSMQYAPQMQYMPNGPLPRVPQTQAHMCMPSTAQPRFVQLGQTCPSLRVPHNRHE